MTMNNYSVVTPKTTEQFSAYYRLRYQELRQPWGQPIGSEVDDLEAQSVHRMVCDQHGVVVAVGRFHKVSIDCAQIRFMAVSKDVQGLGLGALLLSNLEQVAIEHGVKRIELNARQVALGFYQANGYRLLKQEHTLYDEVVHFSMDKALEPNINKSVQYLSWLIELGNTWHRTIPASKAQGILPIFYNEDTFCVSADRQATINLHNTMFAGSIYTLATLTGWGWVYMLLKEQGLAADIVLGKADIKYNKPLKGEPVARTERVLTSGDISVIKQGKNARIAVQVELLDGDSIVAIFNGLFFAMPIEG